MDTLKTKEEVAQYENSMSAPPDEYTRAGFSSIGRLWIWFGFVFVMVTFQVVIHFTIENEDEETALQIKRMNFITSKVIDHEQDDNYDDDDDSLLISLTSENDDDDNKDSGGS